MTAVVVPFRAGSTSAPQSSGSTDARAKALRPTDLPSPAVQRAYLARSLRPYQRERLRKCRVVRITPEVQLTERVDGHTGECRFVVRGLQTCGSVHSCPTCASRILAGRADEIAKALDVNRRASSALVTFTLKHHHGVPLALLRKLLALAYSEMKAGRAGLTLKQALTYRGDIRAAEQTVGRNGWHPHLHALWFSKVPIDQGQWLQVLTERWRRCVGNAYKRMRKTISRAARAERMCEERAQLEGAPLSALIEYERDRAARILGRFYVPRSPTGQRAIPYAPPEFQTLAQCAERAAEAFAKLGGIDEILPDFEHGVSVEPLKEGAEAAARYLAKLGLELAGFSKEAADTGPEIDQHYTSWQIAKLAARGNVQAIGRWREHSAAMKGARQLTWSRGLRRRCGLIKERTDAELADDRLQPGDLEMMLGFVSGPDWDHLAKQQRQGLLARLIDSYEKGTLDRLWFVQAAIKREHRLPRPADKPFDVRPTWWDRLQAYNRAEQRGHQRGKAQAEWHKGKKAFALSELRRWAMTAQERQDEIDETYHAMYFDRPTT
jgi:hypothetical protein